MSCSASIVVTGAHPNPDLDVIADAAVTRLHQLEQRWSRFVDTSEITALNAAAGSPVQVSRDTIALVIGLVRGWHLTAGAFDPTLLGALVGLGYAASRDDAERRTSLTASVGRRGRPDAVLVDAERCVVQLPPGTALDPGGLGKGLAADLVVTELLAAGAAGALVEIGGDLRAAGRPPAPAWTVSVDTAGREGDVLVALGDGGVATSTSRFRTWTVGAERRHHLVDPSTLRPTTSDTISCTVVAGSAATAEAFTKVAFAHGSHEAIERLERRGLAASITADCGERFTTPAWRTFELPRGRTT